MRCSACLDVCGFSGLALGVVLVGSLALGGARLSQDKPFVPEALSRGAGPLVVIGLLAIYTFVSLYGVASQKGDLDRWMSLSGAATVVGGLSYLGTYVSRKH